MNENDFVDPAGVPQMVGLVDGSISANTRRFTVVLDDAAVVQLDELLACHQVLGDGREVWHYGIVVEGMGEIEGAELSSDTRRIAHAGTMPGVTSRKVEVQVLRTLPELWLPPQPGAAVQRASGAHRDAALFLDQMTSPLPVGLDQANEPVLVDYAFLSGEKGGHINISGISGVATKTSYALFVLYMLFETAAGRKLLGAHAPNTKALVFNVKGEDLLHIDRPNAAYHSRPGAALQWHALGVDAPGPFEDVEMYSPRSAGSHDGAVATDVTSRSAKDVRAFGWPPERFIKDGLLRFCFVEDEDQRNNQVPFVEQRVRLQLARWAYPLENEPGAVVLCPPLGRVSSIFHRVIAEKREPRPAGHGTPIRNFDDLVDYLGDILPADSPNHDSDWIAGAASGTVSAFLRRLFAHVPRLGHLITCDVAAVELNRAVTVVDIHALHDTAQRFVVGALLSKIFEAKQGSGREPLRFIVLDELNKYAPRTGNSPIKDVLVDIAARGRSLGVILIGAQQAAGEVDGNIIRNAAIKVVGRLDASEAQDYRFLSPELRERSARFLPGTMVLDQPLVPAPIPLRFPFPNFATNVGEGKRVDEAADRDLFGRL